MGVDLVKIKEGIVENGPIGSTKDETQTQSDSESSISENEASLIISESNNLEEDLSCLSIVLVSSFLCFYSFVYYFNFFVRF